MSNFNYNPKSDAWFPQKYLTDPTVADYLEISSRIYSGSFSNDDWQDYYERKLRDILRYVVERSPHYREALSSVDVTRVTLQTLHNLPFTTKEDIRVQGTRILSMPLDGGAIYYETTGTTGRPLQTPRSWFEAFASNYHFSMNMADVVGRHFQTQRPIIGILGPTEIHSLGDGIGDVFRNLDVSHVKFWPYSPKVGFKRASELVSEVGVNVLFGTPAVILPMIRFAKEAGANYEEMRKTVKMILTLGEVTSPAMRDNLSALYGGARCQSGAYGGTELFVVSSSCGEGRMHFAKQNYIAEILDPWTGEPVDNGKIGELVLTFLLPGIRPLIRYRTGDLVSADHSQCSCGNPAESFVNHGRKSDILLLGDSYYFASDVEQMIMAGISGFFGYQITIDAVNGTDKLHVDLEPLWERFPLGDVNHLVQQRLAQRLGIPVTVATVDKLPPAVNTGGFLTWKSARVNDLRSPADADRKAAIDLAARWLNGYTEAFGNA